MFRQVVIIAFGIQQVVWNFKSEKSFILFIWCKEIFHYSMILIYHPRDQQDRARYMGYVILIVIY